MTWVESRQFSLCVRALHWKQAGEGPWRQTTVKKTKKKKKKSFGCWFADSHGAPIPLLKFVSSLDGIYKRCKAPHVLALNYAFAYARWLPHVSCVPFEFRLCTTQEIITTLANERGGVMSNRQQQSTVPHTSLGGGVMQLVCQLPLNAKEEEGQWQTLKEIKRRLMAGCLQ